MNLARRAAQATQEQAMNQDPFGNQQYQQQPRRRGFNPRLLFAYKATDSVTLNFSHRSEIRSLLRSTESGLKMKCSMLRVS